MSRMVRCAVCDSFIKPASIESGACPFCPSASAGRKRNPIPGLLPGVVLAAALSGAPGCDDDDGDEPVVDASSFPDAAPVYGIAIDAGAADATPAPDAQPADAAPIYGVAPDDDAPKSQ